MAVDAPLKLTTLDSSAITSALRELTFLRKKMIEVHEHFDDTHVHSSYQRSARNLLSYLALRRHDIRPLQYTLSKLGLSSLGRSEANVVASVSRVIEVLERLSADANPYAAVGPIEADTGESLLITHADALFGAEPPERNIRIMVTMPGEAATDPRLIDSFVAAGMDCQRINCAHDSPVQWAEMIRHLRQAASKHSRACSVMMDLAGPKLRTGALDRPPQVIKVRPRRDVFGRVQHAARTWLCADEPSDVGVPAIQIPEKWLRKLKLDDVISFSDARESKRSLRIAEVMEKGCWAALERTAYLIPGLTLNLAKRAGREKSARVLGVFGVKEPSITLEEGETLTLTQDVGRGSPALRDDTGKVLRNATIGCTLASVFSDVKVGDPIWFDDGKIGGSVTATKRASLTIRITHAPSGAKLKSGKGINLPSSDLRLDALSEDDVQALEFACEHADVVQLSFVNTADDVRQLITHLRRLNALDMGVVLKIETRRGFENLPELLLAGMELPRLGVMIARGDLAIENGFERMAEIQEEILCICEAAHVPVIWATQVLESLAKKGSPSRAEITDAATAVRAECVMLNKGPHVCKAISALDDVLTRMQTHRAKTINLMRKLRVADAAHPHLVAGRQRERTGQITKAGTED